jgi:hypothetical protein
MGPGHHVTLDWRKDLVTSRYPHPQTVVPANTHRKTTLSRSNEITQSGSSRQWIYVSIGNGTPGHRPYVHQDPDRQCACSERHYVAPGLHLCEQPVRHSLNVCGWLNAKAGAQYGKNKSDCDQRHHHAKPPNTEATQFDVVNPSQAKPKTCCDPPYIAREASTDHLQKPTLRLRRQGQVRLSESRSLGPRSGPRYVRPTELSSVNGSVPAAVGDHPTARISDASGVAIGPGRSPTQADN